MYRYRIAVIAAAALVGSVIGIVRAPAGHLQSCAVQDWGDYRVHKGTDAQNHCFGQDGPDQDYIYGYGALDELNGQKGYDSLRGAGGDDELRDPQGSDAGDFDGTCHGSGSDYSDVKDLDGKDIVYYTNEPDGSQDLWNPNQYDEKREISGDCPFADPVGA